MQVRATARSVDGRLAHTNAQKGRQLTKRTVKRAIKTMMAIIKRILLA